MGLGVQTEKPQKWHHTQTLSSHPDDVSTREPFLADTVQADAVPSVSGWKGEIPESLATVSLMWAVFFGSPCEVCAL